MKCPACNSKRHNAVPGSCRMFTCKKCGALHGTCSLGDSYGLVKPHMIARAIPPGETRYFDLTVLGSQGIDRRHGWYDPVTRLMTQVG